MGRLASRWFAALAALFIFCSLPAAAAGPDIIPLSQIKPGMKGVGYTIFSGDKVQTFDVEVIGVMPDLVGPKQNVVLVRLSSPEITKSGVVAGMSGSPVYFAGKLAGAIAFKFGTFTTEAIAGMTPIEDELAISESGAPGPPGAEPASASDAGNQGFPPPGQPETAVPPADERIPVPEAVAQRIGVAGYLEPIASPLIFSGFLPSVIARFSDQFEQYGMVAGAGGTAPASPTDSELKPGDMAGMVLIKGDLSVAAGCTVTAHIGDRVYLCGHPLMGFGKVHMPLARAHVLATLASSMESTKIMNTGGIIGSITEDRVTGVMGRLGPAPAMIPVSLTVETGRTPKQLHFQVMENSKLTPLLVTLATLDGVRSNISYNEGATFQLSGSIDIAGHSPVRLENMFVPSDQPVPDAFPVAMQVEGVFDQIFHNPYEQPHINDIRLTVRSLPDARWATIDSAWSDKTEVHPGETVLIKVALRPYRGAPFTQQVPITIPAQASPGPLHVLVSDATEMDRIEEHFPFGPRGRLAGLEELIRLLNQERRNDRLYVALLNPAPTLLVEDKRLPNAPLSEINVLGQRSPGRTTVLWQSELGERSVAMHEVVTGEQYLTLTVK
ncbi:MAG TPA: SpoIVB peptidase S55 domain-containing protein [Candidatus Acidoferrales bacterium]|nr:SpoIVB peptidase S55 domain-containing protein [Candidatus Acidoferrales bacterium]